MVVFSAHRRSTSFMTSKLDPSLKNQGTLDDNDIEEVAQPTRRSALATVGAALAGAVFGAAVLTPGEAAACNRRTGRTDSDPSDGVGRGRTGLTDSDAGRRGRLAQLRPPWRVVAVAAAAAPAPTRTRARAATRPTTPASPRASRLTASSHRLVAPLTKP
jgi:hypothetical protein